jgi:hypothetical protein
MRSALLTALFSLIAAADTAEAAPRQITGGASHTTCCPSIGYPHCALSPPVPKTVKARGTTAS